ncbi:hypothetical protein A3F55_01175 [Candidatus Adlerbacteria bacterium RIFCSPHIGHO2_12_FULL_53_18]|uniref:RDD domain-containing protein n=1 Tax=Candidatus Adlerbacteria bacterium RIFCSPHIGHO2_12_FULL_53_18 TaxID=1797242 RepID=A0A1F4XTP2_9BACT|nr:MAG: hypothetical protein A3F55_01175 [Candidatus Adlerbacteria bacterium RIFCSPHIGHO2_12_FULL_53_18]
MFCQKCGNQIPEGAQFCTACGAPVQSQKHTAATWHRLGNFLLDVVGAIVFTWIVTFLLFILLAATSVTDSFFVIPLMLLLYSGTLYYIFFESIWQRTPGKWATGTKVVKLDGTKPGFWRIVGRSFSRLIPFEALSFLFGHYPYGWHDRISKTMVVPATHTVEEAASINPKDKGQNSVALIIFGLIIAALILIAIIGILSGIVLASLNSAREGAQEAHVRAQLSSLRLDAEMYAISTESYEGFCDAGNSLLISSKLDSSFEYECNDSAEEWAVLAAPTRGSRWCADSSGELREVNGALYGATQCPIY